MICFAAVVTAKFVRVRRFAVGQGQRDTKSTVKQMLSVILPYIRKKVDREFSQNHQQCACADERTADKRFCRAFLVQKHKGEHQRQHDAQLVDRHDL